MTLNKILKNRIWPAAWQIIVRFYAFLLLPLLAWGVNDLSNFFSNPARLAFAILVLVQALIVARQVYILPPQPRHDHPTDLTHWQIDMYHVIFIVAAYGDKRNILTWAENLPVRWVGLGIFVVGVALSIWANHAWINHLRSEMVDVHVNPALLLDGPYKYIRHPALLCLIIYCLGFALAFRSWAGLVLLIPLTAGFMHRINAQEKNFAEQYKQVWLKRQHTSKRLFPFVY